jgi:hypothetical protein
MIATDQRASKKRLPCESFCRMAATVSSVVIASSRDDASCASGHARHNPNPGISQPPRQIAQAPHPAHFRVNPFLNFNQLLRDCIAGR